MKKTYITKNFRETQTLGEILAKELQGGEIIALSGELGGGKTTFAQGVLKGLKTKGPYTSPTFLVMKHYKKEIPNPKSKIQNIYHIDCYRIGAKDILDLGWEEIIASKKNVAIVEWAERIKRIVPSRAVWVRFKHKGKSEREINIKSQCQNPNDK